MADESIVKANFPAVFSQYVRQKGLSYGCNDTLSHWVFWDRNYGDRCRSSASGTLASVCAHPHSLGELCSSVFSIEGRTVAALAGICLELNSLNLCFLLQFWSPKKGVDGRLLLTTSGQPFGLSGVQEGLCSYRLKCREHKLYLDKEEVGPVERVFRGGIPELSPDVQFYSETEYPHHADATYCKIRQSLVMPLFDCYSNRKNDCIGVLELVTTGETYGGIIKNKIDSYPRFGFKDHLEDRVCYGFTDEAEIDEIDDMLCEVCAEHDLAWTQTWFPSEGIDGIVRYGFHCNASSLKYTDDEDFWEVCQEHGCMREGQGVVGKAFLSRKSCFCNDISKFTMSQYPLAHYARHWGLTSSFAVYLEDTSTGCNGCVVEFFLRERNPSDPSGSDVKTLLYSIMATMKQHLQLFKIPTSEEFGYIEVYFVSNEKLGSSQICQASQRLSPTPEILHSGGDSDQLQLSPDQQFRETAFFSRMDNENNIDPEMDLRKTLDQQIVPTNIDDEDNSGHSDARGVPVAYRRENEVIETSKAKPRKTRPPISKEVLEQHYGRDLKEAAASIGVSRSTLKRYSREYGISRWPSHKRNRNRLDHSCPDSDGMKQSVQVAEGLTSVTEAIFGAADTKQAMKQDSSAVTIKATYNDRVLKFPFALSSGVTRLTEEVAKRLKLKIGGFVLQYKDEEGDCVLIAEDPDLQSCVESMKLLGSSIIRIAVMESMDNSEP